MRIALAQFISGPDPEANLRLVADYAERASARDADLLLCPEATMRCFGLPLAEIAEPVDGPWASRLAQIAHWNDLVIAAGMFTPGDAGRVRNTVRVVGEGIDASYDKIHLFDAFGFTESSTVTPGTSRWSSGSVTSRWASPPATTSVFPGCSPHSPIGEHS